MSTYLKTRAAIAAFDAANNDFLADDQAALTEKLNELVLKVEHEFISECPRISDRYRVLGSLTPTTLSPGHQLGDWLRHEVAE